MNYEEFKKIVAKSRKIYFQVRYFQDSIRIMKSDVNKNFYDDLLLKCEKYKDNLDDIIYICRNNDIIIRQVVNEDMKYKEFREIVAKSRKIYLQVDYLKNNIRILKNNINKNFYTDLLRRCEERGDNIYDIIFIYDNGDILIYNTER